MMMSMIYYPDVLYKIVYEKCSEFKLLWLWDANAETKVEQTPSRFHWSIPSSSASSLTLARSYRCYSDSLARNAFIAQKRYTSSFIHQFSEFESAVQSVSCVGFYHSVMNSNEMYKLYEVLASECSMRVNRQSEGRLKGDGRAILKWIVYNLHIN